MKLLCYSFCLLFALPVLAQTTVDSSLLMKDIRTLSADKFEGRKAGTRGSRMAQFYIIDRFKKIGLSAYHDTYEYPFYFQEGDKKVMGTNLYGYIPGKLSQVIVISAHYDHLGTTPATATSQDTVYNGADDNASGVGGLLAMAQYFKKHPPRYTLIFAALDGEEEGLQGAKAFLLQPPVPVTQIRQNINMDMIAHNDKNELYVCGTYQYPDLKKYIDEAAAGSSVKLIAGHDKPDTGTEDWTKQSDQYEFYQQKIPFLYFGVEDHPDYHHLTDEYTRINHSFYYRAVQAILQIVEKMDRDMPENKYNAVRTM
ncbi:peptidase M28-like protein [Chitinophaga niastensis]|uniref:Peptidase M28-like protein n=1 Tax=Chitinophaga niastensis TaxID=536980 RepID=A0A2P8HSR8_CHINA|nr:M28 family peptidase [Chitinophaga niastensis]PSL49276.1 peptidase M28-like protein [Chitinophaga niastensis]